MLVYRLEHKTTRKSPYYHETKTPLISKLIENHQKSVSTPIIDIDFNLEQLYKSFKRTKKKEVLFGFQSEEKLCEWYNEYLVKLTNTEGFEIVQYNVDAEHIIISKSKKQLAFFL